MIRPSIDAHTYVYTLYTCQENMYIYTHRLIIARLIKSYDELFRVYNDLCTARNKDSRLIVDIGSTVDKRFEMVGDHLVKEIADLKDRIAAAGL